MSASRVSLPCVWYVKSRTPLRTAEVHHGLADDTDDLVVLGPGVDLDRPVLRARVFGLKLVTANSPFVRGSTSLACVAQPPDERPDRDAVDVQDVLGEVDPPRLVLRVVAVGAELHVAFRAVMRRRKIRPRLRLLPSERGAAETASSASPAAACGICRRAVDAYQHWPRGVFARSADERSTSYDAIRPIGSFARRPFFAQALLALLPWL